MIATQPPTVRPATAASVLLLASVALAFADASVVALALPDLYSELETSITAVSWVLTTYALAGAVGGMLCLAVLKRTDLGVLTAAGAGLFALSSLAAGLAPDLPVLLAARAVQGLGAAALVTGALAVLVPLSGDRAAATRQWALAGAVGAVVGPALGGVITQFLDWRAVFFVQAPIALGALLAVRRAGPLAPPAERALRRGRGSVLADLGFVGVFGALVGALFLSVILLVVVWQLDPIAGAALITALPLGTLVAGRVARQLGPLGASLAGGALLAGGLTTLAFVPGLALGWALLAFFVSGLGFGLAAGVLGPLAVPHESGPAAATVSFTARHLGLVLGLVLIAPVLSADIEAAADEAPLPATAALLDAPISTSTKVAIAFDLRDVLEDAPDGEIPQLGPVFERHGDDADLPQLRADIEDAITDIVTRSFRHAFLIAAALALAAGLAALAAVGRRRRTGPAPAHPGRAVVGVVIALAVAAATPAAAALSGGAESGSVVLADPCDASPQTFPERGLDAVAQRLVLSGLNGAACELGVSREELVLSFEPRSGVDIDWDRATIEQALRTGVDRAIADADARDTLPGWMATVLRRLAQEAPVSWFLEQLGVG